MPPKLISLVSPKGGSYKSTLVHCLAHSAPFKKYRRAMLELDPQGTLSEWFDDTELKTVPVIPLHSTKDLAQKIEAAAADYELLFLDCPGESEAKTRTRLALVLSNLCILPIKDALPDIHSALTHLLPLLPQVETANLRGGKVRLLATGVHVNARAEKATRFLAGVGEHFHAVYRERPIFSKYMESGHTLETYTKAATTQRERQQALLAFQEVNLLAKEIHALLLA